MNHFKKGAPQALFRRPIYFKVERGYKFEEEKVF